MLKPIVTYSEKEAAVALGVSVKELQRERSANRITYHVKKEGKKILYRQKDLDDYVNRNYRTYNAIL
jgi:hypothetical protein